MDTSAELYFTNNLTEYMGGQLNTFKPSGLRIWIAYAGTRQAGLDDETIIAVKPVNLVNRLCRHRR